MKHFHSATNAEKIGLSTIVDVFDRADLFEVLDNDAVLTLSRLGGKTGFRDSAAIRRSTGITTRRRLRDGIRPLDLAVEVCRRLETVSGCRMGEFDAILLCHSNTDSNACYRLADALSQELGLSSGAIAAFNHGCSGFIKLVPEGAMLLDSYERNARVALVSVETPEYWHDGADRLFCGIVSAGATAAVLETGRGLPVGASRSDDFEIPPERRLNADPLFRMETTDVFDFRGEPCHRTVMRMNAEPVFINGIELMLDNLRAAMLSIDRQPGQRVVVAPHQPSGKLLRALIAAAVMEFPDVEFLNNLESYGNTISSSVPTLMSRIDEVLALNKIEPLRDNDHIILLAAGICMTDIADRMAAGHTCLQWRGNTLNVLHRQQTPEDANVSVS
ncbi:MAG: 3-oxoacyl-[acyl-carrier-protein] synthase III C-terminal domain-containing protein [Fuerstiella sp.]|nr:3-oxoacyl-[acyl-carrier-protein] synthase III C-terminal domain-containing protein [Fuerstiella sp.]